MDYYKDSLFAMHLPRRVWVLLWLGAFGLSMAAAFLARPFLPPQWGGFPIGAVTLALIIIASGAPPLTAAISILFGELFAVAAWYYSLHLGDPRALALVIASGVFAGGWAYRERRRRAS